MSKLFQYYALVVKPPQIPSTETYTIKKSETMSGMPEVIPDWCFSTHHSHLSIQT